VVCLITPVSTDVMSTRAPVTGSVSGPVTRPVMICVVVPICAAAG
jgi:hypothetical protein